MKLSVNERLIVVRRTHPIDVAHIHGGVISSLHQRPAAVVDTADEQTQREYVAAHCRNLGSFQLNLRSDVVEVRLSKFRLFRRPRSRQTRRQPVLQSK